MTELPTNLSPYRGYAYAYPHKTAYRALKPSVPLTQAWENEDLNQVFVYAHIPLCEMRCGFCNLFTTASETQRYMDPLLDAMAQQVDAFHQAVGVPTVALGAIGGGTPTLLDPPRLHRLFDIIESLGGSLHDLPMSIETSPATATPERLAVLVERTTPRISMGVQSFVEAEVKAAGRPQTTKQVEVALDNILQTGARFNIDLIYGLPHQTDDSWRESLRRTLAVNPDEVFLYPLYVRPLTGLGRKNRSWDDQRLALYRIGRDVLLEAGYTQHSMRLFRKGEAPRVPYRCQADGMVGLGAGARSYTSQVHYATEYGVGVRRIHSIVDDYLHNAASVDIVYGFLMTDEERQRRHVMQSLLQSGGLEVDWYQQRFGADPQRHFPLLDTLVSQGFAQRDEGRITLTPLGMEMSDWIGPALQSQRVQSLMDAYQAA